MRATTLASLETDDNDNDGNNDGIPNGIGSPSSPLLVLPSATVASISNNNHNETIPEVLIARKRPACEVFDLPPCASSDGLAVTKQTPVESTGGTACNTATTPDVHVDTKTSKDYYFDSYAHHAIHEEMLKDDVRTRTYETAILQNKHLFQNKVVLDVGCGTAILSMFACQAGAKHVIGVDCSSIIHKAQRIVELNGFADRITLIQGKVEEIELPVTHVDIIVSEWMGYFLLYESMLDTVLYARDKWLVPGGIIFPDKATMYICAAEDGQGKRDRIAFWENVYGFNMMPLQEVALQEPVVDVVAPDAIVTNSVAFLSLDILTCTKEDLSFEADFELEVQRNDFLHGFVVYFECAFTQVHKPIGFSTAPFARYTHWKQTMLYLKKTLTICQGERVKGSLKCKPNANNNRDLDIELSVKFDGQYSKMNSKSDYKLR